jgi:radical SAM protein with 4Fe4S-binding SPASM domain
MNEALFKKIIDELSDLNYSGEISLFSNNEPLMDDRVVKFHKYAREKLPNARLHMFTNGTLFTLPLFIELVQYLDELIIDNYQQELKLIKPVQIIKDYVEKNPELRNKVTIALRKRDEILTSRGGDAPNRQEKLSFKGETCALPFEQMIIRPDGKVSLCCNDPIGKVTLGDVSKQSLVDVWYGEDYSKVRDMIVKGRENIEHCRYCDTFYLY